LLKEIHLEEIIGLVQVVVGAQYMLRL